MKIHNLRLGFACNSSSSHSLIFLKNNNVRDDGDSCYQEFGWDTFTLSSENTKMGYLGQQIVSSLSRQLGNEPAKALATAICGVSLDDGYVDHQSVWTIPYTWDEKNIDTNFLCAIRDYLKHDDIVILGGNDNDGEHPLSGRNVSDENSEGNDFKLFGGFTDGMGQLISRFDPGLNTWTLFDRKSGTKLRLSFEAPAGEPFVPHVDVAKATQPELVDVKITDRCPFECEHCLDPDTFVLMEDFSSKRLKDVKIGDNLFAFQEKSGKFADIPRKTVTSKVTAISLTSKEAFKITTSLGRSTIASADHRWLNGRGKWLRTDQLNNKSSFKTINCDFNTQSLETQEYMQGYIAGATAGDGTARWERPSHLVKKQHSNRHWRLAVQSHPFIDRVISYLSKLGVVTGAKRQFDNIGTWQINVRSLNGLQLLHSWCDRSITEETATDEFARGWLSGFYDAEGCTGNVLRIAQKTHPQHTERAMLILQAHDFKIEREYDKLGNDKCVRALDGIKSLVRFASIFKPATVYEKITPKCINRRFGSLFHNERIVSITPLGQQDLIDITTTSQTFVANGIATHNCYQGSTKDAAHADPTFVKKLLNDLADSQVFEVAYGGGEPTTYPEFLKLLKDTRELKIIPNFTTRNIAWVHKFSAQLTNVVGRIAVSVDFTEEINNIEKYIQKYKQGEKSIFNMQNSGYNNIVTIQHVVGAVPQKEFERLLALCATNYISITLLGWKNTGRGSDVVKHEIDWMKAVKKAGIYQVHIDTALARSTDMKDVDKRTYHTTEGSVSAYVDAVQQKVGPSSYANSLVMRPYTCMTEDWKKVRIERGTV